MILWTEIWIGNFHHIKMLNQRTFLKMKTFWKKNILNLIIFELFLQLRRSTLKTTTIYCCGCGWTKRNGPEFGPCMYGEAVTTGGPFITGITWNCCGAACAYCVVPAGCGPWWYCWYKKWILRRKISLFFFVRIANPLEKSYTCWCEWPGEGVLDGGVAAKYCNGCAYCVVPAGWWLWWNC